MTKAELQERIAKKQAQIDKRIATTAKLQAKVDAGTAGYFGEDDLKTSQNKLKELEAQMAKFKAQLERLEAEEKTFTTEIPEAMKQLKEELKEEEAGWLESCRENARTRRKAIGEELKKVEADWRAEDPEERKYGYGYMQLPKYRSLMSEYRQLEVRATMTDEQIEKEAERDSKALVLDAFNRTKAVTGRITECIELYCTAGNYGAVLNGYIKGEKAIAKIQSIEAGGWNIQRRHIRVLVHQVG